MFKVVAGYYPVMERLSLILSELDILTTFASVVHVSSTGNTVWSRPKFSDGIKGK